MNQKFIIRCSRKLLMGPGGKDCPCCNRLKNDLKTITNRRLRRIAKQKISFDVD